MSSNPYPLPQSSRILTGVAWSVTILVSSVADIAWMQLTGSVPDWLIFTKLGFLLGLSLAAWVWKPLRPLSYFFITLSVFFGLNILRPQINFTWPFLQRLFGNSVFDLRMQAEQTGKLAASLVMILANWA